MQNKGFINKIAIITLLVALISFATGCSNDIDTSIQTTTSEITSETNAESTSENSTENITEESTQGDAELNLKANLKTWKLGNELILYVGNNRSYDWYLDQAHTGEHSNSNCGPTSVAMAAKWANASFEGTAESAREAFRSEGGWWYNDDIEGSLKLFNIDYKSILIEDAFSLRNIIDSGRIAIINNSMAYITREDDYGSHKNRFYDFDSGHYFIVKGYAVVDQTTYFEVYDPNNWDMTYEDGSPMGKDRYYESSVLMDSINNWYPYAIVIQPKE